MTTREARHSQEMRRRARRRAEERGEAPPAWAVPREDPTSTRGGGRDLTREILRWGVARRAALALERQAAAAAEAATMLPAIRATATADTDERIVDRRHKARRAGQGPEARMRWASLDRGSEAVKAAVTIPCPCDHAPASTPCWDVLSDDGSLRMGLCGDRIRAAGFTGGVSVRTERTSLGPRHP